jgi:hypothetical protein
LEHAGIQSGKSLRIKWSVARWSRGHRSSRRIEVPALVVVGVLLLLTAVLAEIVALITRLRQLHIDLRVPRMSEPNPKYSTSITYQLAIDL